MNPFLGNSCKFYPSCSCYATDALKTFSFPKALLLIGWRILRCHPFTPGGFDPLPLKSEVLNG